MKTLALAKQKYQAKVSVMPANYAQGMAAFLGMSASAVAASAPGRTYASSIGAGTADKWERNLRAAFGG